MAGLFGTAPQPNIVPLDPGTQQLLDQGTTRAGQDASTFAGQLNQGVSQAGNQLGESNQQLNQQGAAAAQSPGMMQAIRNAYSGQTQKNIQAIQSKNQQAGLYAKLDYTNQMARAALMQQNIAAQNYTTLTQAYNQAETSRAQFVNSLFQTVDVGIGIMAGKAKKAAPTGGGNVGGYGGGGGGVPYGETTGE